MIMAKATTYKPPGYQAVIPYLIVNHPKELIKFAQAVFGATLIEEMLDNDGGIVHAEVRIGDCVIMMSTANDKNPSMACMLHLYVPNCDEAYHKALGLGVQSLKPPTDEFYGTRSCGVLDANGIQWWAATHMEDLSHEEMQQRLDAYKAR